jgi:hypothetical protein
MQQTSGEKHMSITKLLAARRRVFEAYDAAREISFRAANERDALLRELAVADREIQNFLRTSLPS